VVATASPSALAPVRGDSFIQAVSRAQLNASDKEKARWEGPAYSRANFGADDTELVIDSAGRIIIPKEPKEIRETLLKLAHDLIGHPGSNRTILLLHEGNVHWHKMSYLVRKYVDSCDACQRAHVIAGRMAQGQ